MVYKPTIVEFIAFSPGRQRRRIWPANTLGKDALMEIRAICLVLVFVNQGCSVTGDRFSEAPENDLEPQKISPQKEHNTDAPLESGSPRHVLVSDTEYYSANPRQGQPADGTLTAGSGFLILSQADRYLLVRSDTGNEVFIDAKTIEQELDPRLAEVAPLVAGCTQFAMDLYQQLQRQKGNLFFSPASISIALAMTSAGAAGETRDEIMQTLHFGTSDEQLHVRMSALQQLWTNPLGENGIQLRLANRLWGQEELSWQPAFMQITRENYNAELAPVDFITQTEKTRETINAWVEEQTEKKITDLFPPGSIHEDTRLVLANAVYFHGIWTEQFRKDMTKDTDFHLTPGASVKVPMMHQNGRFLHTETDDLQVLGLPYGDGLFSMIILLPKAIKGLADLEAGLNPENLERWISSLGYQQDVEVSIPKFRMTTEFKMVETLQAMGLRTAFTTQADFSGMTHDDLLYLDQVVHQAFVDVNEEGTEAAAATGVSAMAISAPRIVEFRADHPFVFLIRDNRTGLLMFVGRITDPRS